MTATALANEAGLTKSHLSQIEQGKISFPNADIRRRVATALGVSHLELLIAAGEITEDEITRAGAVSTVQDGPIESELIAAIRAHNWESSEAEFVKLFLENMYGKGKR